MKCRVHIIVVSNWRSTLKCTNRAQNVMDKVHETYSCLYYDLAKVYEWNSKSQVESSNTFNKC